MFHYVHHNRSRDKSSQRDPLTYIHIDLSQTCNIQLIQELKVNDKDKDKDLCLQNGIRSS